MPQPKSFSPSHPYWDEAIRLKRDERLSNAAIAKQAKEDGFPDLTEAKVRLGFSDIPTSELYPNPRGGLRSLRNRHKKEVEEFNSVELLKSCVVEAVQQMQDTRENLADENNSLKQMELKREERYFLEFAKDLTLELANLEIKGGALMLGAAAMGYPSLSEIREAEDVIDAQVKELPSGIPATDIKTMFGTENIRMVGESAPEDAAFETEEEEF